MTTHYREALVLNTHYVGARDDRAHLDVEWSSVATQLVHSPAWVDVCGCCYIGEDTASGVPDPVHWFWMAERATSARERQWFVDEFNRCTGINSCHEPADMYQFRRN